MEVLVLCEAAVIELWKNIVGFIKATHHSGVGDNYKLSTW